MAETARWGLTRVAYGCRSLADIVSREPRLIETAADGQKTVVLHTARAPRRNLSGGSLFWVVQHMLVARQPIAAILAPGRVPGAGATGQKSEIHLVPGPIPVRPRRLPSHQGWRYLPAELWPIDLAAGEEALPAELAAELAGLFLS